MSEIDIGDLYTKIASYKGMPFPVGLGQLAKTYAKQWTNRLQLLTGDGEKDLFGQPIIMPVTVDGLTLGAGEDNGKNITIQPLVIFEAKKRMAKSVIAGGTYGGTVKEFINFDDYKISIVGALQNRAGFDYPLDQVKILKKLWKRNEALSFQCQVSEGLFSHAVMTDLKFKELSKSPDIQLYEMKLLSDSVVEVEQLKAES